MSKSRNLDGFLNLVLRIACEKHASAIGEPCFLVPKMDKSGYNPGICNRRAVIFGYNANISPKSLKART